MSEQDNKFTYPGAETTVMWDGNLCIHVGECGRSSGGLFVGGRQPWCQPDVTSLEDAVEVVEAAAVNRETSRFATIATRNRAFRTVARSATRARGSTRRGASCRS